jgi:2'-5' RNA ligase
MRAFVAVHLPREVKAYLGQLSSVLMRQVPSHSVRWVEPERMHLTLRFIGDMERTLLPDLARALDEAAARHRPFALHLEGFGCFPDCKRPRVLWAGVNGDLDLAASLKKDLDLALVPFGWEPEKPPYHPHLTLGRVKDAHALASQQWPAGLEALPIAVESAHLIESELTRDGPIYTVRHSSPLRG